MTAFKHPFQRLRYSTVRDLLVEELGFSLREAWADLKDGGRLPGFVPDGLTRKRWYAKDVEAFVAQVKRGQLS